MGYDPNFITDFQIALPELNSDNLAQSFDSGNPVDHIRFSLVFNEERSLAFFTAHNIDGNSIIPAGTIPRRNRFRFDVNMPNNIQLDNDRGYRNNAWDRGHLVRRQSLHWGDINEATQADSESFYWSNIAPQHENLHDTSWGSIEDWIFAYADINDLKASVFTGPIFSSQDPEITNRPNEVPFRLPAGFWKIFALKIENTLSASAFLVWQRDYDREAPVSFSPVLEQVRITTIEYLTGLMFHDLRNADSLLYNNPVNANMARVEHINIRKTTRPSTYELEIPQSTEAEALSAPIKSRPVNRAIFSVEDLFISKTSITKSHFKSRSRNK